MCRASRARVRAGLPAVLLLVGLLAGTAGADTERDDRPVWHPFPNPCGADGSSHSEEASGAEKENPCGGPAVNPCGGAATANPCGGAASNPCAGGARHDPGVEELIDEFVTTGEAIRHRTDDPEPARFPGSEEQPAWFQALVVTRDDNPLLDRQCKREAMSLSLDTLRRTHGMEPGDEAVAVAAEHIRQHRDFISGHRISYAEYLRQISECRSFCAPLVASLVRCHVLSVSRLPHSIVGFELDSAEVAGRFDRGLLAEVAERMGSQPDAKILLVGRASRIGDLRYNRRLSAQRALAVKDRLVARGVPEARIETLWLGWEPPQISESVAAEYGFEDLYRSEGTHRINQSVVLVVYRGGGREPL